MTPADQNRAALEYVKLSRPTIPGSVMVWKCALCGATDQDRSFVVAHLFAKHTIQYFGGDK